MSAPGRGRGLRARALGIAVTAAAVSLLLAVALTVLGHHFEDVESLGPTSWSYSAHGTLALERLLEGLGIPVARGRFLPGQRAPQGGVTLVVDPGWVERKGVPGERRPARVGPGPPDDPLLDLIEESGTTLVALPKWDPVPGRRDGWVDAPHLLAPWETEAWLEALGVGGEVERVPPPEPGAWHLQSFGGAVEPAESVQLVVDSALDPVVACPAGVLLGETRVRGRRVWVLSDPDLLSTHGLARPGQAVLAVEVIEHLRRGGPVVLDETLHGFTRPPGLWDELLAPPLGLLVLAGLLLSLALCWRGAVRWGSARPPAPALEPGNRTLVRHAGALLAHAGYERAMLSRYLGDSVRWVAARLHLPEGEDPAAQAERLDAIASARRLSGRVGPLRAAVREGREPALELARRIHAWREEILDGPGTGSRPS